MKNLVCALIVLICFYPKFLQGQSSAENQIKPPSNFWKNQVRASMISRVTSAYEFDGDQLQMLKLVLKPEVKVKVHKNLRLTGIGRLHAEMLDEIEPGKPTQDAISKLSKRILIGDRFEFELRELYLDWYIGSKSTLRLGKQQIVWGETDGLKLLDVVNPQNLREFVLEEFEDSRIPLWAIKAEFPINNINFEMSWIPDLSYHNIPDFEAPFFPVASMPRPPEDIPVILSDVSKPDRIISDSDIGIKASTYLNGWDLTLNYLYHYDDLPVPVSDIRSDPDGELFLSLKPEFKRLHTLGGTFNNALGPFTLRGEMAFNLGRHFITKAKEARGSIESNQFMFALGLDRLFNETMLSLQIFNDVLPAEKSVYNRDRYEANLSFLISQELWNDDLKLDLLLIQNLNHGDGMCRPKASYYARSNFKITMGTDIFYGNKFGLFGQFQERSRLFVGMEWGI